MEEFWFICCTKLISLHWCREWQHQDFIISLWDFVQGFVFYSCVCEECATYFPVTRLIDRSDFGGSFGCFEDAASDNIKEIIFLVSSLMCNNSTVFGGIMWFFLWGTDMICVSPLRASPLWCSWLLWCVGSIGISRYWGVLNPDIARPFHVLPHLLGQMVLYESTLGHLSYL